jgi:hypothetical protein
VHRDEVYTAVTGRRLASPGDRQDGPGKNLRLGFFAALTALMTLASAVEARADETFGLAIWVAAEGGAPIVSGGWIDAQVADAEQLFGPIGVHFRTTLVLPLPSEHAHLETRADRDALAAHLIPGAINVFVVASLRDVDDPSLFRMGVCWRRAGGTYLVVDAEAVSFVLAHELGHFFGNPHSSTPNNCMSYDHNDAARVFFDEGQARTIRKWAKRHIAERRLVPLSSAGRRARRQRSCGALPGRRRGRRPGSPGPSARETEHLRMR